MKIGNDITAKKTAGLSAKEREDFERFVQERKRKQLKEEEEQKLTSKMPDEQVSDDKVADEMSKLAQEKSVFSNNRQRAIQDIEAEESE